MTPIEFFSRFIKNDGGMTGEPLKFNGIARRQTYEYGEIFWQNSTIYPFCQDRENFAICIAELSSYGSIQYHALIERNPDALTKCRFRRARLIHIRIKMRNPNHHDVFAVHIHILHGFLFYNFVMYHHPVRLNPHDALCG